jgi:hypothetical protein
VGYDRFTLEIDTDHKGRIELVWTAEVGDDLFQADAYFVSSGNLVQASEIVRDVLRRLVAQNSPMEPENYESLLRELRDRGNALFRNLFPASAGDVASEFADLLRTAASASSRPTLVIIICNEMLHVPWGFICDPTVPQPRLGSDPMMADFAGFWLSSFKLITKYQGGSAVPRERRPTSRSLYALHETLFASARKQLRLRSEEMHQRLDILLGTDAISANTWTDCSRGWSTIAEDHDSILYLFGHSNGEYIVLDESDAIEFRLPASSFSSNFPKDRSTRSASICILNGCRTAAPPTSFWPASFLKATLEPGFFGFIGTEVEVPNDFASLYGVKLLWQLVHDGQALGEAFDSLRHDKDLFPRSLIYSCFANRNFKLPAVRPVAEALECTA